MSHEEKEEIVKRRASFRCLRPGHNSTIRKNEEDRYEVQLPWKSGHPSIEDNFQVAEQRRLEKDGLTKKYDEIFDQWEKEGLIEEVHDSEASVGIKHYLPHHPVLRPGSNLNKTCF